MNIENIEFIFADQSHREWFLSRESKVIADHMHIEDGFTILAMDKGEPVAVIAVYWKNWIKPLEDQVDGYIDIIDVKAEYRKRGIAKRLIEMAEDECRKKGVYQIRAWSSEDKVEAIPMWRRLGYGMCPTQIIVGSGVVVNGYYVAKVIQGMGTHLTLGIVCGA